MLLNQRGSPITLTFWHLDVSLILSHEETRSSASANDQHKNCHQSCERRSCTENEICVMGYETEPKGEQDLKYMKEKVKCFFVFSFYTGLLHADVLWSLRPLRITLQYIATITHSDTHHIYTLNIEQEAFKNHNMSCSLPSTHKLIGHLQHSYCVIAVKETCMSLKKIKSRQMT